MYSLLFFLLFLNIALAMVNIATGQFWLLPVNAAGAAFVLPALFFN